MTYTIKWSGKGIWSTRADSNSTRNVAQISISVWARASTHHAWWCSLGHFERRTWAGDSPCSRTHGRRLWNRCGYSPGRRTASVSSHRSPTSWLRTEPRTVDSRSHSFCPEGLCSCHSSCSPWKVFSSSDRSGAFWWHFLAHARSLCPGSFFLRYSAGRLVFLFPTGLQLFL